MIQRFLSTLGSWVSVAGVFFWFHPSGQPINVWEGIFIGISMVFLFRVGWLEIKQYNKIKRFPAHDKSRINNYMHSWISMGDRVAIFTRDMSWGNDRRIKNLLSLKAQKDELSIYVPITKPLIEELKAKGAHVFTYSQLEVDPQSRFTIINYGKGDAQVAIGRTYGDKHIIEEFAVGDHPVFNVVVDLVRFLTEYNKKNLMAH